MSAGQQTYKDSVDHILLADDDFSNFVTDFLELRGSEL